MQTQEPQSLSPFRKRYDDVGDKRKAWIRTTGANCFDFRSTKQFMRYVNKPERSLTMWQKKILDKIFDLVSNTILAEELSKTDATQIKLAVEKELAIR